MNARELIEEIQSEKKVAVSKGILREEKVLDEIRESEIPRKLPEGWEWCRLGDYAMKVTDYVASGSFASLKENVLITNDENYAVMVKTADFANGFTKNLTYTDEHGYNFLENSNLFGGELILSNIGSIEYVEKLEDPELLITVDCQYGESNVQNFGYKNLCVIDHHEVMDFGKLPELSEVHENYGSCSTVVYKLLKNAGYKFEGDCNLQTALFYGLYMDTGRFQELWHPADRDM